MVCHGQEQQAEFPHVPVHKQKSQQRHQELFSYLKNTFFSTLDLEVKILLLILGLGGGEKREEREAERDTKTERHRDRET